MNREDISSSRIDVVFVLNGSVRIRDHVFVKQADHLMRQLEGELGLAPKSQVNMAVHISVRKRLLSAYKKGDMSIVEISVPIVFWLFYNHPENRSKMRAAIEQAAGRGCTMIADCVERGGRAYWAFSIVGNSQGG